MTYIIAGLKGKLENYKKLQKAVGFGENDVIYFVGGESVGDFSLYKELSMTANVYPILSRADYTAAKLLSDFERYMRRGETPEAKYINDMKKWIDEGEGLAFETFRGMDADMKEGILEYINDFAWFEETEMNGKEYIILAGGISGFDAKRDIYEMAVTNFASKPLDMEKKYCKGKIMITAWTKQGKTEKIARNGNNISLDCTTPVCFRLEDEAEFYI